MDDPDRAGGVRLRRADSRIMAAISATSASPTGRGAWASARGSSTSSSARWRWMPANCAAPLPFVIWESHRPKPDGPGAEWDLWAARTQALRPRRRAVGRGRGLPLAELRERRGRCPAGAAATVHEADGRTGEHVRFGTPEAGRGGSASRGYHSTPGDALYDRPCRPIASRRLRPAKLAGLP